MNTAQHTQKKTLLLLTTVTILTCRLGDAAPPQLGRRSSAAPTASLPGGFIHSLYQHHAWWCVFDKNQKEKKHSVVSNKKNGGKKNIVHCIMIIKWYGRCFITVITYHYCYHCIVITVIITIIVTIITVIIIIITVLLKGKESGKGRDDDNRVIARYSRQRDSPPYFLSPPAKSQTIVEKLPFTVKFF